MGRRVRRGVGLAKLKRTAGCRQRPVSTQERVLKKRGSGVWLGSEETKDKGDGGGPSKLCWIGGSQEKWEGLSNHPRRGRRLAQRNRSVCHADRRITGLSRLAVAGGVSHLAMESTGVYWRPIFNLLESDFEVRLVNAQPIQSVPGRKSDVQDAQWLGELLQPGLLKARFIPPLEQRDLRGLTRYRTRLVQERTPEINRVPKVLEDAHIKLGSVASNLLGVSGPEMLEQLIAGQDDPAQLAQLARGRLPEKIAQLERALQGHLGDAHRLLLKLHWEPIDELNAKIAVLSQAIDRRLAPFDPTAARERLDTIPGVNRQIAEVILAELGTDMSRFPTAAQAASWAGLAPGKNESAGKNRSGQTRQGNRSLKAALTQAAHAASKTKATYLAAQFRRLAARRGKGP